MCPRADGRDFLASVASSRKCEAPAFRDCWDQSLGLGICLSPAHSSTQVGLSHEGGPSSWQLHL